MSSSQHPPYASRERSPPESEDNNSSGAPPERTKRRPSRAGTRSVSQLSQAQLQRKRANDREAQRAIRQRTKNRIHSLEKRIKELQGSGESDQQLAEALIRNKELEEENSQLRLRLDQAGLSITASERSGSWDEMAVRTDHPPLQGPSGIHISSPQAGSPTLMSPRDSHSLPHPSYGFQSIAQWQATNPFTEGAGSRKSADSGSPASQVSPQQYTSWTATGTDRTQMHPQREGAAIQPAVQYPGITSGQSAHVQNMPYQSVAVTSAHIQGGLALAPSVATQYGPIPGVSYLGQHTPQQHSAQRRPSLRDPSRTPSSQSTQGSQSMYYGNYPPPS